MISKMIKHLKISLLDLLNNVLISSYLFPIPLRPIAYRLTGNIVELGCYFSPNCFVGPGKGKLIIGKGTFVNYGCFFDLNDNIYIGKNCNLAMNIHFINGTHEFGDYSRRAGQGISKPIIVEDGCWIGADTIIMPGVKIGKGCIIGAGSLINKDCLPNNIYVGRPAKVLRSLTE